MAKKKYRFYDLIEGEKDYGKQKFANDPHKEAKEFYQNRKEQASLKNKFNMGGEAESCGCSSCMEERARGAGAAIKGTGFKGVF
jgi:hypothetical protein